MKIVIATPLYPPEIGGPATHCALLENHFLRAGVKISVVKFSTVRHLPKIIRHFKYAWLLWLEARKSDLIYVLDPVSVGLPAVLASLVARRPLVVKVVGDYAWEQGRQRFGVTDKLDKFVNHRFKYGFKVFFFKFVQFLVGWSACSVVVPSAYLGQIVAKWGIKPSRLKVIYNAFDARIDLKPKDNLRTKLGYEGFVVITAGRLVPWKGISGLVEAVVALKNILPELNLIIAGDGPDRKNLESLVRRHGVMDYVTFTGQLAPDDLFCQVKGADLFVLNSEYEGFSHLLLEVMALGTPIVATEVGGNPELITSGDNGILVSSGKNDELQAAILWLAKSPAERKKLSDEALVSLGRFSEDKMIKQLIEHLKTII
ncbi:MAG: glycosyltransferase family 4 protein [Patescibacteria group bacterium]